VTLHVPPLSDPQVEPENEPGLPPLLNVTEPVGVELAPSVESSVTVTLQVTG
jgi:hypothetical protein